MPMIAVEDGVHLYFTVTGQGVPLVLIHPPVLSSMNFKYQVKDLSREFQVITFDIRGHGRSNHSSKPISYPLIVDDIITIMDHLGIEKAFICGYSTGGSIVLEFLLNYSSRAFGGIVISGMPCVRDHYIEKKISNGINIAEKGAVPLLAASIAWTNSDTKDLFLKLFSEAKKGDAKNIEEYYLYSLFYDCTSRLQDIKLPVLLLFGSKDKPFHPYAKLLHENLPSNELVLIEGTKHQLPTKASKRVNALIKNFVTTQSKLSSNC
ncbi:alpha/beta fold hydrolase [Peribacillus alkalitolerans]|uniref:alpha/beta fold hydrolase n=1 Tax=Peribacillus alkalitolerans TaxID=1550385 RepID=UPI0013D35879|nr:alpha/beta hydrolase [Peribacillus alkalitolerans]